jgi:hypothetical protein
MDAFPSGSIKIPLSPFVDVLSITYFDSSGRSRRSTDEL